MRKIFISFIAITTFCFITSNSAFADRGGHGHWGGGGHGGEYHGHESYGRHWDREDWHHGGWHNDWHDGHFGWWWVIGDFWYPYARPVYPYPTQYYPSTVVVEQAPALPPSPPVVQAQPQASVWYYCDNPSGYYPYVPECRNGWRTIPAAPPGMR